MTIESRSVSVDGGERQMSQTSFFSWCWDTKKKTAQLDSRNTRPWHFKMFQINGDAKSKVRKKTREGANKALEECAQYQKRWSAVGGDSFFKRMNERAKRASKSTDE